MMPDTPVILIEAGPKTVQEARQKLSRLSSCIAIFRIKQGPYHLFLKAPSTSSLPARLDSAESWEKAAAVLKSSKFEEAKTKIGMDLCVSRAIKAMMTQEPDFDNRGVFSSYYIRNRMFRDLGGDYDKMVGAISKCGDSTDAMLKELGWQISEKGEVRFTNDLVTLMVVDRGVDLGIKRKDSVAPSYTAVSLLKKTPWVILTNGRRWRLYGNKVSASTTNYFELDVALDKRIIFRYLAVMFGADSYAKGSKSVIETIFASGKTYAKKLEDNMAEKVLQAD